MAVYDSSINSIHTMYRYLSCFGVHALNTQNTAGIEYNIHNNEFRNKTNGLHLLFSESFLSFSFLMSDRALTSGDKVLVDALPYIDGNLSQDTKDLVDRMVEDEMMANPLDEVAIARLVAERNAFDPAATVQRSELIQQEFDRIQRNIELQAIDTARYAVQEPDTTNAYVSLILSE